MTPELKNIMKLADRDLASGRYADAEAEYARVLEGDPDCYEALHARGIARTWRSTLLDGDPIALINSTEDALKLCRKLDGDEPEFMNRVSFEIINLTSTKYNELTRIYTSIARKENLKAPSPLFFYTWSSSRPQGLTMDDVYIPMINYLAAIIMVSEYLDRLLAERDYMKDRRLHNAANLNIFYDWLISFEPTGWVHDAYYKDIVAKREKLASLRDELEAELGAPELQHTPSDFPQGRPLPGIAIDADREKKVAHFPIRPPFEVICPVCGTIQKSNRSICYQCSCKFFFDDDVE